MAAYRALLAALVAATGGCSVFKAPGIAVLDATLIESTDEAIRFDVALDLTNPNNEALEIREFSYSFTVAGSPSYTGRWAIGRTLAPGHRWQITLPAVVAIDAGAGEEPGWRIRGNVLYVSPGALAELLLDSEVREPRARFRGRGTVRLAGAAAP